ncbi:hypothetical protein HYT57_04820 [Candidatus Woesearchaeota archaeon]|nr:hypothetical protein [Candidatus Woesearchaeota archaeon]
MEKKRFKIKCQDCDAEITGFSEHHVKQNLYIHQQTSQKHKDILKILKKRGIM